MIPEENNSYNFNIPNEFTEGNLDSFLGNLNEMESDTLSNESISSLTLDETTALNPEQSNTTGSIFPVLQSNVLSYETPMEVIDEKMGLSTPVKSANDFNAKQKGKLLDINPIIPDRVTDLEKYSEPIKRNPSIQSTMGERLMFDKFSGDALQKASNTSTSGIDETSPQARPMTASFDSLGVMNSLNSNMPSNRTNYT
tara:strand:+ start:3611 stop:4204 length:594 start_codon:yes stop_codon:yes gene_type:complete